MMVNWEFFQRRVCLTTIEEEWQLAVKEFGRVGLVVDKFQSLPDFGPHQSFSKSERQILIDFYESDADTLLHLEDDVQFRDLHHLNNALAELPVDWDIIYLGANLVCWGNGDAKPQPFSGNLYRVKTAWTTHAIGYNKRCVLTILENQPGFSTQMYDQYLSGLLPDLNAFVVKPMAAYQRPHKSSIWDRFDDYTQIFIDSDAKMR